MWGHFDDDDDDDDDDHRPRYATKLLELQPLLQPPSFKMQHFVSEGPKNTLLAQVYPWRLTYKIADILIASMRKCHIIAMHSRFYGLRPG
jgi:hypothetical protein